MTTNNERVADASKTIDHIANVNKKVSLTEQWKKGELTGEYWCQITESPYPERVYLPTCDSNIIVKVLAPVPSFEQWQSLNELLDSMQDTNKALAHKLNICKKVADLEAENVQLRQFCEEFNALNVAEENQKLGELLKDCKFYITNIVQGANSNHLQDRKEFVVDEGLRLLTEIRRI